MATIGTVGETGLLRAIQRRFGRRSSAAVLIGPGDDAAALRFPAQHVLIASQDELSEGAHFELSWSEPRRLAGRLFRVNVSDLAAMGRVRPLGCLVSAALPSSLPRSWFDGFLEGCAAAARRWRLPLVGGNLCRSERVVLGMCVLGTARPGDLVRRSGARPGDLLAGVGPLGAARAGLEFARTGRVPAWARPLARAFWEPEPLLGAGARLAGLATALLDNSDGLAASARILAEASGVGMEVSLGRAPLGRPLGRYLRERRLDPDAFRLAGGEDYGLVFTVRERRWPEVLRRLPDAYTLGRVRARSAGLRLAGGGALPGAFSHFAPAGRR